MPIYGHILQYVSYLSRSALCNDQTNSCLTESNTLSMNTTNSVGCAQLTPELGLAQRELSESIPLELKVAKLTVIPATLALIHASN